MPIRQLEGLAHQQPVLMIFEHAHWVDPTSRELLDLTIERLRTCRCCLSCHSVLSSSQAGSASNK
jgi:predicted ATPase